MVGPVAARGGSQIFAITGPLRSRAKGPAAADRANKSRLPAGPLSNVSDKRARALVPEYCSSMSAAGGPIDKGRSALVDQLGLALAAWGMGTWSLDLATREFTSSATCLANYGRAPDARLTYDDLAASVHEDDRRRWRESVDDAVARAGSFEIGHPAIWPDGLAHWVLVRGNCIVDAGRVTHLIGVSADIDAQKRAQESLADAKTRLEATLAAGEVATWTWNIKADRVHADRNLARLFDVSEADANGGPIAAYLSAIHPDDREATSALIQRALAARERYEARYRVRGADGRYRWVVARGHAEYDADGSAVSLPGVIIDVTGQRQAEHDLEESQHRLRSFFDAMGDGFVIFEKVNDAESATTDFRYVEVNPAFASQSGLTDVVGRTLGEVGGETAQDWVKTYDDVLRTREPVHFERVVQGGRVLAIHAMPVPSDPRERVAVFFQDVSERHRAEKALRDNEERLRHVLEATGAFTWELDMTSGILSAEQKLRALHAYAAEGPISFDEGFAALHPDDAPRVRALVAGALANADGGRYRAEYRIRALDGAERWIEARGLASFDGNGKPMTLAGTGMDITARKEAEAEREQLLGRMRVARAEAEAERHKLRDVFMQTPVAVAILEGPEHRFIYANASCSALVGGRELVGKTAVEAFEDVPNPGFVARLSNVLTTGVPYFGKEIAVKLGHHAASDRLYVNISYTARRNAEGTIDGVLVSAVDLTEQVLARQRVEAAARAQRKSEERLRRVLEASGAGLWELDPETGTIESDRRMVELMGLPTGSSFTLATGLDTLPPEDAVRVAAAIEAALGGANDGRYLTQFRTGGRGGVPMRWVESRATVHFDPNGKPVRLEGAMVDITARKQAEQEREVGRADALGVAEQARVVEEHLRREAETATRAKDEFLAMLGHEMRNPLAPITTALQLMKMRDPDAFANERTVIERQVAHLAHLVEDLLDVSRITSGKIDLERRRVSVASVVANAIETVSPLIEQRQHRLHVNVPPTGLYVDGDAARLAQVVTNLLTNAAKYTKPGGRIDVTASQVGAEVVLRVRDDGVGMAPETLPHIFELFVQERQAIDRARGGLGLGLTIVRTLVQIHGGTVTAHSDGRDRGSELTIRLPAAAAEMAASARPETSSLGGTSGRRKIAGRRVLVVDDNVDAAELLAASLALMGHETRIAHDGPSALALVSSFEPQVAVLDIGLPVMDGYELGRRLRAIPGLASLRLIALTGYGQASDRKRSADAGFDLHLVKPVELAKLEASFDA